MTAPVCSPRPSTAIALGRSATLHRLTLPLPLQLQHINIYLVHGPDGLALVDTGMDTPAARESLELQLRRLDLPSPFWDDRIGQVFVTHYHADHFGLAPRLQRGGAEVIMPRVDAERLAWWFDHPEFDRETREYFADLGVPALVLERTKPATKQMRAMSVPFVCDAVVEDGQTVDLAGVSFEVVETPGHSPSHACLFHPPSETLLVGDHVLPHITPNISITRDLGEDPLGDYRRSLRMIRERRFGRDVLPAHGEPIEALDRRINEILEHHRQRESLLLGLIEQGPISCYALSEQLFDMDRLDGWETLMATGETLAHLRALEVKQKVEQVPSGSVILFRRC